MKLLTESDLTKREPAFFVANPVVLRGGEQWLQQNAGCCIL